MSVDKDTVARIARLAHIKVADEQLDAMAGDLNNIIHFIEQLSEVVTDDVAPMTSVVHARLPRREDEVTAGGDRDAVLSNAPMSEHGFFAVPKVIE